MSFHPETAHRWQKENSRPIKRADISMGRETPCHQAAERGAATVHLITRTDKAKNLNFLSFSLRDAKPFGPTLISARRAAGLSDPRRHSGLRLRLQ